MIKSQLFCLFRKHTAALFLIFLMIILSKVLCLYLQSIEQFSPYLSDKGRECYHLLLDESKGMSLEERTAFISALQIDADTAEMHEAIGRYTSLLQGCYRVKGYIDYAKNGRGIIDMQIPHDLVSRKEFYASLETPTVIDTDPFYRLLKLLTFDISPVWVMLLVGVFSADGYEKRVNRQIDLCKRAKSYYLAHIGLCTAAAAIIYTLSFLADMLISGAFRAEYFTAAFQSTGLSGRLSVSVFGSIILLFISGLFSVLLCVLVFELAARLICSVKGYILFSVSFTGLMTALAYYIKPLLPFMFAALKDKGDLLAML